MNLAIKVMSEAFIISLKAHFSNGSFIQIFMSIVNLRFFSRYTMLPTSICNLDDFNDKLIKLEIILQLTFIGQLVNKKSISALPKIMQTLIKLKESQWIHFSFKKAPLTHFRIWIKVCVCVCVCVCVWGCTYACILQENRFKFLLCITAEMLI